MDKIEVIILYRIGSDQRKISDWIKRMRSNRAEWMKARRSESRIFHCGNVQEVDKRLGEKERLHFEEKDR